MSKNCALLVVRLPLKHLGTKLNPILNQVCSQLFKKLYIKIDVLQQCSKLDLIDIIPSIYKLASSINPSIDVRVLNPIAPNLKYKLIQHPSKIFTNSLPANDCEQTDLSKKSNLLKEYLESSFSNSLDNIPVECLPEVEVCPGDPLATTTSNINMTTSPTTNNKSMYEYVALGGTFDGIHVGHKILFNEATMRCQNTLLVGVTDESMIKTKILWELIGTVDARIDDVRHYLSEIDPGIKADVVPISNIYGPTIERENLQYLVVSQETKKGGFKINEARVAKSWNAMEIGVVDLLCNNNDNETKSIMQRLKETKVSSSVARLQKLGTIIKPPKPNTSIPEMPYIIGLTGGVASGKTAIGKYLESLGFGYINYDTLGHKAYSSTDSEVYKKIVSYFGNDILNSETLLIERPKLGKIVFNDKQKKDKLESIVWPAIYSMVDEEIEHLKQDHQVIVLESALLLESKQDRRVHQIWTVFVPPEVAIERQIETRNLSREDAEKRVRSQFDNSTRIQLSNAVFCSIWEPEFTHYQVDKCVTELREKYLQQ